MRYTVIIFVIFGVSCAVLSRPHKHQNTHKRQRVHAVRGAKKASLPENSTTEDANNDEVAADREEKARENALLSCTDAACTEEQGNRFEEYVLAKMKSSVKHSDVEDIPNAPPGAQVTQLKNKLNEPTKGQNHETKKPGENTKTENKTTSAVNRTSENPREESGTLKASLESHLSNDEKSYNEELNRVHNNKTSNHHNSTKSSSAMFEQAVKTERVIDKLLSRKTSLANHNMSNDTKQENDLSTNEQLGENSKLHKSKNQSDHYEIGNIKEMRKFVNNSTNAQTKSNCTISGCKLTKASSEEKAKESNKLETSEEEKKEGEEENHGECTDEACSLQAPKKEEDKKKDKNHHVSDAKLKETPNESETSKEQHVSEEAKQLKNSESEEEQELKIEEQVASSLAHKSHHQEDQHNSTSEKSPETSHLDNTQTKSECLDETCSDDVTESSKQSDDAQEKSECGNSGCSLKAPSSAKKPNATKIVDKEEEKSKLKASKEKDVFGKHEEKQDKSETTLTKKIGTADTHNTTDANKLNETQTKSECTDKACSADISKTNENIKPDRFVDSSKDWNELVEDEQKLAESEDRDNLIEEAPKEKMDDVHIVSNAPDTTFNVKILHNSNDEDEFGGSFKKGVLESHYPTEESENNMKTDTDDGMFTDYTEE